MGQFSDLYPHRNAQKNRLQKRHGQISTEEIALHALERRRFLGQPRSAKIPEHRPTLSRRSQIQGYSTTNISLLTQTVL